MPRHANQSKENKPFVRDLVSGRPISVGINRLNANFIAPSLRRDFISIRISVSAKFSRVHFFHWMCCKRQKFDTGLFCFALATLFVFAHVVSNYKYRIFRHRFFSVDNFFQFLSSFVAFNFCEICRISALAAAACVIIFCFVLRVYCRKTTVTISSHSHSIFPMCVCVAS